jgi:hypothetical protein
MGRRKNPYSERVSCSFTVEQKTRLQELSRVRSRKGRPTHISDLVREAVAWWLQRQEDLRGSRAAIVKGLEGRLDDLTAAVSAQDETLRQQTALLEQLVAFFRKRREG